MEDAFKVILDNDLIDIDKASEDAVDTDGVAHFLSSYDGKENAVLIEDGYIKANEFLKSMFPLHFPNNDTDK